VASARGEAKLTFCEVMIASGSVFCASLTKGPTSRETVWDQGRKIALQNVGGCSMPGVAETGERGSR
jgi:hypothetical protein